jgi:hypothetical protein
VLAFDPVLSSGQKLSISQGWNDYRQLTNDYMAFMQQASGGRVRYRVALTTERNDLWLVKEDGFTYTEAGYLDVLAGQAAPHRPDTADYAWLLSDPAYEICGRLNRGEIDEIWMFAAPWFGFYESRLVGPGGFEYNAPPLELPGCTRLAPIMGFNYERGLDEMVEDFGHRSEASMTMLYGSWEQNRTAHNWDRFALSAGQSPDYTYAGCGSIHYPPNASSAYEADNPMTVLSNCDDFKHYPHLSEPLSVAKPVSCATWGCSRLGYFTWWLEHLPANPGTGPDGRLNDWWAYVVDPGAVADYIEAAPPASPTPKPTAGMFAALYAELPGNGPAQFYFTYSGQTSYYDLNISTLPDMSWDVYLHFAVGAASPLVNSDPAGAWAKYRCGVTLYWRVITAEGVESPIQASTVTCAETPTASLTPASSLFSDLSAELPGNGPAKFYFSYAGEADSFTVNISTLPDMSWDVYLFFAAGTASPLVNPDPAGAWAKYRCGARLYWRVETAEGVKSEIQEAMVTCR